MTASDLQMTSEVTHDLEDDPTVFAMQISNVWYQNIGFNENNWFKASSVLQVTASDLQMTSEVTCDLKDVPQVFAMQISHVLYQNNGFNETNWFKSFLDLQVTTSDLQMTSEPVTLKMNHIWHYTWGDDLNFN